MEFERRIANEGARKPTKFEDLVKKKENKNKNGGRTWYTCPVSLPCLFFISVFQWRDSHRTRPFVVFGLWVTNGPKVVQPEGRGGKAYMARFSCSSAVDGAGWPQAWGEKLMGAFSCLPEGQGGR